MSYLKSLGKSIPYNSYTPGLGYSPGSGPPIGDPIIANNFFEYSLRDLLPNYNKNFNFGKRHSKRHSKRRLRRRSSKFGNQVGVIYPLSDIPQPGGPNLRTFPQLGAFPGEVGPGNTPGGYGGPLGGSVVYGFNTLLARGMGYGGKKSRKSKKKKRLYRPR